MWIFHKFNPEDDTLRFMEKDIIYTNNLNAFVLDSEAIEKSTEQNDLVLKCYYAVPVRAGEKIIFEWKNDFVTLDKIMFRVKDYKVFFYDSEGEFDKMEGNLNSEIEKKKLEEEKRVRELKRIEQQEEDEELERAYATQRERRKKEYNKNSPLQNYFRYPSDRIRQNIAQLYLDRGFEVHRLDEKFLAILYKKNINNDDREFVDSIVYAIYFIKAEDHELMSKIIRVQQPLNIFLSLKLNKIFGYKFPRMIQIVHVAFDQYKKYGDLFFTALKKYNQMNSIIEDDRNGKLNIKIENYHRNRPQQNHDYDDLFKVIFPELFENK